MIPEMAGKHLCAEARVDDEESERGERLVGICNEVSIK